MGISEYKGIIERYKSRLPVNASTPIISLNEGHTPLIQLHNLTKQLHTDISIYVKFEGLNPTGSFKDRGMTMAVSKAVENGSRAIICASTGNTSAAAAAYAARADIQSFVLIPEGKIARGKLIQAQMHGATVIQFTGNFDSGMALVKQLGKTLPLTIVNSINPYRLQGQKTAAFEIIDELGQAPDYHCIPVGNAGNMSAYWMGYTEYYEDNICKTCPIMLGYQAEGAAPFLKGVPVNHPETIATAIRIGNPQSWDSAHIAQRASGGWFASCTDQEILAAQKWLAETEGIFCEPASAISIAGLINDIKHDKIPSGSVVVCTLTGNGLKDPDIIEQQPLQALLQVEANVESISKVLSERL